MKKNIISTILIVVFVIVAINARNTKKDYEAVVKDSLLYSTTAHELNWLVMGNNISPIVASRNYLYANVLVMK